MTDFDPNAKPETQEQADAYVRWCAGMLNGLMQEASTHLPTYQRAYDAATLLVVVASAQLHLDDQVGDEERDGLLGQLAKFAEKARCLERKHPHVTLRDVVVMRGVLDCWTPIGRFAPNLLMACKTGVNVALLVLAHPLEDLWTTLAPDLHAFLTTGYRPLEEIGEAEGPVEYDDYSIVPNQDVIDRMNWQKVNAANRAMGGPRMSQN